MFLCTWKVYERFVLKSFKFSGTFFPPSVLANPFVSELLLCPSILHTCPSDIWVLPLAASQGIFHRSHSHYFISFSLFAHLLFHLPRLESNCFDWNSRRRRRRLTVSRAGNIICSPLFSPLSALPVKKTKQKQKQKKQCFWQMPTLEENNFSEKDKRDDLRYGNKNR